MDKVSLRATVQLLPPGLYIYTVRLNYYEKSLANKHLANGA
jgi:hypothetical protein